MAYSAILHSSLKAPNFSPNSKFILNTSVLKIWSYCHLISLSPLIMSFYDFNHCCCVGQSQSWFSILISHLLSELAHQAPCKLARTSNPPTLKFTSLKQRLPSPFPHFSKLALYLIPSMQMTIHSLHPSIMNGQLHCFSHWTTWVVVRFMALCIVVGNVYRCCLLFSMLIVGDLVQAALTPSWTGLLFEFLLLRRISFLLPLLHFTHTVLYL